ncbi:unnamed protein product [Parajaminaea phylloscopi]
MRLIQSPNKFYKAIEDLINRAQDRVYLSSLYIGKEETDLLDTLRSALRDRPGLRATIVVDALRSTREGQYTTNARTGKHSSSCASLLASLARDFPDQVDICLYRTPGLSPWFEKLIGKRIVEGAGLQHMKIYGGDDEFIISGANLSHDYFCNRQDRYLHFWDQPMLSNYMHSLVLLTCHFSYRLVASRTGKGVAIHPHHSPYELIWEGCSSKLLLGEGADGSVREDGCHGIITRRRPLPEYKFAARAGELVESFTTRWRQHCEDEQELADERVLENDQNDLVYVVPLLQMGPMKITQETDAMPILFELMTQQGSAQSDPGTLDFTTGYFSLHPLYKELMLQVPSDAMQTRIIAAAPESNGFFGSKGISRFIPPAYTWLERKFWKAVQQRNKVGSIELLEWIRSGWTYHAKGLWWTPPQTQAHGPTHTLIGSSNFGSRSALRDLECTFLVEAAPSGKSSLTRVLREEVDSLRRGATSTVDDELFAREERKVPWLVRLATELIKTRL